jgi:hypothetical protein
MMARVNSKKSLPNAPLLLVETAEEIVDVVAVVVAVVIAEAVAVNVVPVVVNVVAVVVNVVPVWTVPVPPSPKVKLAKKLPRPPAEVKVNAMKERDVKKLIPSIVKTELARLTVATVKVAKAEVPGAMTRKPVMMKLLMLPPSPMLLTLAKTASNVKNARNVLNVPNVNVDNP